MKITEKEVQNLAKQLKMQLKSDFKNNQFLGKYGFLAFRRNCKVPRVGRKINAEAALYGKEDYDIFIGFNANNKDDRIYDSYKIRIVELKAKEYSLALQYTGTNVEELQKDINSIFWTKVKPAITQTVEQIPKLEKELTIYFNETFFKDNYYENLDPEYRGIFRIRQTYKKFLRNITEKTIEYLPKILNMSDIEYRKKLDNYLTKNNMRELRTNEEIYAMIKNITNKPDLASSNNFVEYVVEVNQDFQVKIYYRIKNINNTTIAKVKAIDKEAIYVAEFLTRQIKQ